MEFAIQITLYLLVAVALGAIIAKTGHNPFLAILAFVPMINLILLAYLALSRWPIEDDVGNLRAENGNLKRMTKDGATQHKNAELPPAAVAPDGA